MRKAFVQLHIAVFLAGFTGVLGRLITLNEGLLVWYRLLISAATMWVLYLLLKRIRKVSLITILKIAAVGLIATLHWITFYASIKHSNVSVGLVCFSSIGFFTALFEPLILKKRINKIELLLGVLVMAGVYFIFHFDPQYKIAVMSGIISAMLGSLFPIYNRIFLRKNINVETLITWELTAGFFALSLLLPVYLYYFPVHTIAPGWKNLFWLLSLSLVCSVLAFQLSANALKKFSAFTVNLFYNLEPVYGILLAFIIYQENKFIGQGLYIGFACIALALGIQFFLLRRKRKVEPTLSLSKRNH